MNLSSSVAGFLASVATLLAGEAYAQSIVATPAQLDFGNVSVNTSSPTLPVTVKNTGGAHLAVHSIKLLEGATQFMLDATECFDGVPAGGSCRVYVTYTPTSGASTNSRLALFRSSTDQVVLSTLTGKGVQGTPSFSVSQLTFNDVRVDVVSATKTVVLKNTGQGNLTLNDIYLSGDSYFNLAQNDCPDTLAPQASCTLGVNIRVPNKDTRTGYLVLNAGGTSQSTTKLQLYATPQSDRPLVTVAPTSLVFADTEKDKQSTLTFTIKSTGNATANVSAIKLEGTNAADFSLVNGASCVGNWAPGTQCEVTVRFTPGASGVRTASATVVSNSVEAVPAVTLTGKGLAGDLFASPTALTFGSVAQGSTATRTVVITSTGQAPVTITSFTFTGAQASQYTATGCLNTPLPPGQLCTVTVTHAPSSPPGATSATLNVNHDGQSTKRSVTLSSTVTVPASPQATVGSFVCSSAYAGETSTCTATLNNTGSVPLAISSIARTNNSFSAPTHNCGPSLAPGNSCTIGTTVSTMSPGNVSGTFTVNSNGAPASATANVSFLAPTAAITVTPFAATSTGAPVTAVQQLRNTGARGTIQFSGAPFVSAASGMSVVSHTCSANLAPGASCSITMRCDAASSGSHNGTLTVPSNAGNSTASLTCAVSVPPAPVAVLGDFACPSAFAGETVTCKATLRNSGTAPLTVSGASRDNTAFTAPTHNCPAGLPVGGSCEVTLSYTSVTPGSASTNVTVASNGGNVTMAALATIKPATASLTVGAYPPAVKGSAVTATHTVKNTSAQGVVSFTGVPTLGANSGMTLLTNGCTGTLAPGATCSIVTQCNAVATNTYSTTLTVPTSAASLSGTLSCTVTEPQAPGATLGAFTCTPAFTDELATCTAELKNPGNAPLSVSAMARTGTLFTAPTSTCGAALAAGATCVVTTTVRSSTPGPVSTNVSVTTNAGVRTSVANAVIDAPTATLTIGSFGPLTPGQSGTASHTLRNGGTRGVVTVTTAPALSTSPSLQMTSNTCTSGLALGPGESCTVATRCTASAANTFTANLSVGTNAGPKSGVVTCQVSSAPTGLAQLGPFTCETVFIGQTGKCTATLRNAGNASLTVGTGSSSNTAFKAPTHACASPLPPGGSCTVTSTFSSTTPGTISSNLTVNTSGGNVTSPANAIVQGAPLTLTMGLAAPTSVGSPVIVTNTVKHEGTSGIVTFPSLPTLGTASDIVFVSKTCTTLSPGQSCTITTRCTAARAGQFTDRLTVPTSQGPLQGEALCNIDAAATASPELAEFECPTAYQGVAVTCTASLRNAGSKPLTFSGVPSRTNTQFGAPTHTCGTSLAAGATCQVKMTQTFATAGTFTTAVNWTTNVKAVTSNARVVVAPASATLLAVPVTTQVGATGNTKATLTNTGGGPLTVNPVTPTLTGTAWKMTSHTCPASLPAGASCVYNLACTATSTGNFVGTISVNTLAGKLMDNLSCTVEAGNITVTPDVTATTTYGTGSKSGTWRRVRNAGAAPVTLTAFKAATDSNTANPPITFVLTASDPTNCRLNTALAPGASCRVFEQYTRTNTTGTPAAYSGLKSSVTTSAGTQTWDTAFTVYGVGVVGDALPVTLGAGVSTAVRFKVTNTAPYALANINVANTGLTGLTGCPATLAAGASCTLTANVTPAATATKVAYTITVNGAYPAVVDGKPGAAGTATKVGELAGSLDVVKPSAGLTMQQHPPTKVGETSTATHTLMNSGTTPITVTNPRVTLPNILSVSGGTCANRTLAAGESCTIVTTFKPVTHGLNGKATLTVTTSAGDKTGTLDLVAVLDDPIVGDNSIDFGSVQVGTASAAKTLKVTNGSAASMTVSDLSLPPGVAIAAPATAGDCTSPTLAAWASCNLRLVWTPAATGAWTGSLVMASNYAPQPSTTVALKGTGLARELKTDLGVTMEVEPKPLSGKPGTYTIRVSNNSVAGTSIASPASGSVAVSATGTVSISSVTCASATAGSSCTEQSVSLAPRGYALFTVAYTAGSPGTATLTHSVAVQTPNTTDTVSGNNKLTRTYTARQTLYLKECYFPTQRSTGGGGYVTDWLKEHVMDLQTSGTCTARAYDPATGLQTGPTSCWKLKGTNIGVPAPATSALWFTGPPPSGTEDAYNMAGYGNCTNRAVNQVCGNMLWGWGVKYNPTYATGGKPFWSLNNYESSNWSFMALKPAGVPFENMSCSGSGAVDCGRIVYTTWQERSPSLTCSVPGSALGARWTQ